MNNVLRDIKNENYTTFIYEVLNKCGVNFTPYHKTSKTLLFCVKQEIFNRIASLITCYRLKNDCLAYNDIMLADIYQLQHILCYNKVIIRDKHVTGKIYQYPAKTPKNYIKEVMYTETELVKLLRLYYL